MDTALYLEFVEIVVFLCGVHKPYSSKYNKL